MTGEGHTSHRPDYKEKHNGISVGNSYDHQQPGARPVNDHALEQLNARQILVQPKHRPDGASLALGERRTLSRIGA
jgi:hypothetical protein